MSKQTHTQERGFSCCIRSDIGLRAAANTYQQAGEQHEVIAQLCFMSSIILWFILSANACDINMFILMLILPVVFVSMEPWAGRHCQKCYNSTVTSAFETGRDM